MIDRVLGLVGLQRRPVASAPGGVRVYAAAQSSRLTGDWITSLRSADQEIKGDLRLLRGAARSLVRDYAYASRYVTMLGENVIGDQGIQLQARLMTTRDTLNERANETIEDGWCEWGQPDVCDVGRRLSWVEMQHQIMRSLAQDGEVLVRLVRGADNPFGFALQVLDADLLDDRYSIAESVAPNGNEIRFGVELGTFGEPVAYWLWNRHPDDTFRSSTKIKRERVPAEEVIHLYVQLRPGQTRGVTWFAPVMLDMKTSQAYQEAETVAARNAAANSFFVKVDPERYAAPDVPPGEDAITLEVEPGVGRRLLPGEDIVTTDFGHPDGAFGPFMKEINASIASGLNVANTSLTGRLDEVNYSSIRAGLLSERDFYRRLQRFIATYLCRRVYRAWLPYAALAGYVSPMLVPAAQAYAASRWRPRGWPWVDPLNDAQAAVLRIQNRLDTRTSLIAEHSGEDYEDVLEQLAEEERMAREAGLLPAEAAASATSSDAAAGDTTPSDQPARATAGVRLLRGLAL